MTKRKHLKRRVRARSAKTGESYTAALRHLHLAQETKPMTTAATPSTFTVACSFCRKDNHQVKKLIAGPGVYICDECIELCNNILGEDLGRPPSSESAAPSLDDSPVERLLAIFAGMIETSRSINRNIDDWALALHRRGVSVGRLAAASGLTEDEARERFKV